MRGTVAIIGSGPAGLFAAWALQFDGYKVTVFEKVSTEHTHLEGASELTRIPTAPIPYLR